MPMTLNARTLLPLRKAFVVGMLFVLLSLSPPAEAQDRGQTRLFANATAIAQTLGQNRLRMLEIIAFDMARAGDVAPALDLARAEPGDAGRAALLTSISLAMIRHGDGDAGLSVLEQAIGAAGALPQGPRRNQALAGIARALGAAGQPGRAFETAMTIPDPDRRTAAIRTIAPILTDPGLLERALAEAGANGPAPTRSQRSLLAALTEPLVATGQERRAFAVAAGFGDAFDAASAFWTLGSALAEAGLPDAALRAARAVEGADLDYSARIGVGVALLNADAPGAAAEIFAEAVDVLNQYDRLEPLSIRRALMPAIAEMPRLGAATAAALLADLLTIVRRLPAGSQQVEMLAAIALALEEIGQEAEAAAVLREATAVAERETLAGYRAQSLARIAQLYAEAGHANRAVPIAFRAMQLAFPAPDSVSKGRALVSAARAFQLADDPGNAGQLMSMALDLASRLDDPNSRFSVLRSVVDELALAGF